MSHKKEDLDYVKSLIDDRVSAFGPDLKFSALLCLLKEEFEKLDYEKKKWHALVISDVSGEFAAKAIGRKG